MTLEPKSPLMNHCRFFELGSPVVTCVEAAAAKEIELSQELKTMILSADGTTVAVHVPGDCRIDLRAVKSDIPVKQAFLVGSSELRNRGLSPGTVTPLSPEIWEMKQFMDRRLLEFPEISTNDGTLTGYIFFNPRALLKAPDIKLGSFSKC